jgi:hypothetical protein
VVRVEVDEALEDLRDDRARLALGQLPVVALLEVALQVAACSRGDRQSGCSMDIIR